MVGPVGFFKTICKVNKLQKGFRDNGGDDGKISGVGNEPGRGEAPEGREGEAGGTGMTPKIAKEGPQERLEGILWSIGRTIWESPVHACPGSP